MNHLRGNPNLGRTELRGGLPSAYTWLYRNDKEWLFDNLPPKKKKNSGIQSKRVNWEHRDTQLADLIRSEAKKIKNRESDPIRVSISQIGKRLGVLSLFEKQISNLPTCKKVLENVTETVEEFQVRRVKLKASLMNDHRVEIKEWRLIRESGLRPDFSPLVHNAIIEEINKDLDSLR